MYPPIPKSNTCKLEIAGASCHFPRDKEDGLQFRLVLSFLLACGTGALAQSHMLHAHRLAGGSYIAASELADYYQLGRNSSRDSDQVIYRQLSLEADRREITVNGVQHWISSPVIAARGQLWITALDVLKTVDPVLRQGRSRNPALIRLIVLDPGHGGSDTGARGKQGVEKTLTLDIARRVERYLEQTNVNAVLTRTSDKTLGLPDRVDLTGSKRADLFVSIHVNSGGSAEGIETYCTPPAGAASTADAARRGAAGDADVCVNNRYDEKNVWLAHCVQRAVLRATGEADRGVRRARFVVIRDAPCPAILVECGFLSSRAEEQRLISTDYREKLAKAIADGILEYRKSQQ
jgi:N-acetylmuramoyl-L-alanine amidase